MENPSNRRQPELPGNPHIHDSAYCRERKGNVDVMRLIDDRACVEGPPNMKPFLAQVSKGVGEAFQLRRRP